MILAALLPLAALSLGEKLDAVLAAPEFLGSSVAASVILDDGTTLYERDAARRLVPASNQKLLTVAFALDRLGSSHRAKTSIWKERTHVVVSTTGDPSLSFSDLQRARRTLGIRSGTPVWVKQPYRPGIPPGWENDDLPNKYAAPVAAFTVDRGSFELWSINGVPKLLPDAYGVKIHRQSGSTRTIAYDPARREVVVAGPLPPGRVRLDTLALPNPTGAAALVLGGGAYRTVSSVPSREPDLVLDSPPLSDLAAECLTKSDNQYAEHLLLAGAQAATYAAAQVSMEQFLTGTVGVGQGDVKVQDGSGLNRHNLTTPRALTRLLQWCLQRDWKDVWLAALAGSGEGTLKSRLEGSRFLGKTGTLDSVSALSGYVPLPSGRMACVSVLVNHYVAPTDAIRLQLDQFVRTVEQSGTLLESPPSSW